MPLFTPEELEELRRADAEIDDNFIQSQEEIKASRRRDRAAVVDSMTPEKRKIAESKRAYRDANREKIAESQRAYYDANREKIAEAKRAYRDANREKYNAYMREYRRKRRQAQLASQ